LINYKRELLISPFSERNGSSVTALMAFNNDPIAPPVIGAKTRSAPSDPLRQTASFLQLPLGTSFRP